MTKTKIVITHDPTRGLWRVEVFANDDCIMSRVAHNESELNDLKVQALQIEQEITRQASHIN